MCEKLNLEVYHTMCGINEGNAKKTENCRGCIYHGEHRDMGATIEVCDREEELGKAVAACENSANCANKLTLADVEKLKAERDAAIADLKYWSFCSNCKWYDGECAYSFCCEWRRAWEWRGVQHDKL